MDLWKICLGVVVVVFIAIFTFVLYYIPLDKHQTILLSLGAKEANSAILSVHNANSAILNVGASNNSTNSSVVLLPAKADTPTTNSSDFLSTIKQSNPLYVWALDQHMGTKSEITGVLKKLLGLHTVVSSRSLTDIMKVVNNDNGLRNLCPHPHVHRRRYFEAFRKIPEMQRAHILFQGMKPADSEFLMPFNKTIIVYMSVNHEFGRENPIQIREWYLNLLRISKDKRCLLIANNLYQQRSLLYFTGVKAPLIPTVSMYTGVHYKPMPQNKYIVITGGSHASWYAVKVVNRTNEFLIEKGSPMRVKFLRDLMPVFKYSDLVKYPCMVHTPYTVSTMSQFEAYHMGIPSFYPSVEYMAKLEADAVSAGISNSWRIYWYGLPILSGGPFIEKDCKLPDACTNPHDKNATLEERKAWWRLSDFYQWKHVIHYDSPEDLAQKLMTTNFAEVSKNMMKEVKEIRAKAKRDWRELLDRLLNPMPSGGYQMPSDYYLAMQERWNVTKSELDESEAAEGPACDMYSMGGPRLEQRPGPTFVK